MSDRPLWRTSTRVLMHELLRREDHAAWRKLLVEMPDQLIIDELERRGHPDLARFMRGRSTGAFEVDDEEGVISAFLGKQWPVEGGDDDPLPFDGDAA